jgi:hypothetical protein
LPKPMLVGRPNVTSTSASVSTLAMS